MAEESYPYGVNWSTYSQVKLEIESTLRAQIFNDITRYADMCRRKDISSYFSSGLDVAADIALVGLDRKSTRLNSSHIPLSRMPSSA